MIYCPYCGSSLVEEIDDLTYYCHACENTFDINDALDQGAFTSPGDMSGGEYGEYGLDSYDEGEDGE